MSERLTAWAIDTRSHEGHGFIGYGWFGWQNHPHTAGCPIALFRTRAIARAHLGSVKHVNGGFPRAAAVKVQVTIATEAPDAD